MPPKFKNVSLENLSEIVSAADNFSVGKPGTNEFLPREEIYDENGKAKEEGHGWGNVITKRMQGAGFGTGREMFGNYFMLCMLGEEDNKTHEPKYRLEDLMKVGNLSEEKLAEGKKIEEMLAPENPDLPEDKQKPKAANMEKLDLLYMRGIKRVCSMLEKDFRNALEKGNFAGMMNPKTALLGSLCTCALTNLVQDCYSIVYEQIGDEQVAKNVLKPGSFIDRVNKKDGAGKSLAEKIFGEGVKFEEFAKDHVDVASFGGNVLQLEKSILYMLRGKAHSNMITVPMETHIAFDRLLKKYRKDKSKPVHKLFAKKDLSAKKTDFLNNRNTTLNDMSEFDYALGFSFGVQAWEDAYPKSWYEAAEDSEDGRNFYEILQHDKHWNVIEPFLEGEKDPLCQYGAAVLAFNGELFHNLKYDFRFKMNNDPKAQGISKVDGFAKDISFRSITRKDMLRAAFLTDMECANIKDKDMNTWPGKIPSRKDEMKSEAARADRNAWLQKVTDAFQRMDGSHTSQEWKNLRKALERAKAAAGDLKANEEPSAEQIARLNSRMDNLRDAAFRYVSYKVETKNFDQGNEYEKLKLAKMIESHAAYELEQTVPAVEKQILDQYTSCKDMKGAAGEKTFMSKAAIVQTNNDLHTLFMKLRESGGRSKEFTTMMTGLENLFKKQSILNRKDVLKAGDDYLYYGSEGTIRHAYMAANAYLQHKRKTNDGTDISAERLEMTEQVKNYLGTLYNAALKDQNDRYASDLYAVGKPENRKNVQDFEKRYKEAEKALSDFAGKYVKEEKVLNDKGREVTKRSFTAEFSEAGIARQIENMYILYVGEQFHRAKENVNKGVADAEKDRVYRMIADGKTVSLLKDVCEKDEEAGKYFLKGSADVIAYMSTKEGREKLFKHIEKHNAAQKNKNLQNQAGRQPQVNGGRELAA